MLRDFIVANRDLILTEARMRVAERTAAAATDAELTHGLPIFLDQLGEALRRASLHEVVDHDDIHNSATHHGEALFRQGLTIAQVVNAYGDLCQVVTGLALAQHVAIGTGDFQTLNLCLDDATAGAVTSFAAQRERVLNDEGTERLGVLAHEMRNALNTAMLSFASIKKGAVAPSGSTAGMLDRSLVRLQALIDRSLADVRLDAGMLNLERVPVWEVIEEVEIGAALIAEGRGLHLEVALVDRLVIVEADRPILAAALSNLLHNALKFTLPSTTVKLRTVTTSTRVLIEIEDQCGGLPVGGRENLLQPFVQRGRDRTGLGLGLSICMKAVKMMAGELHIRDLPGTGCVFTIDLPKQPPPPTPIHGRPETPKTGAAGSGGQVMRGFGAHARQVGEA
jgi:signal transduction histidine kinase